MTLAVQKFGGTSVRDANRIRWIARRIADTVAAGEQLVIAISAIGDETDALLDLAPNVAESDTPRELDMLVTGGERKAAALLCLALHDLDVRCASFTGAQAGILTDDTHMQAQVIDVRADRIRESLAAGEVPVIGGAQGLSRNGDITFLGRGGTDTTAVALACGLDADTCELYTDVEGIFSADPRLVPGAHLLAQIGFEQMLAMSKAGCPKPAYSAVALARDHRIPLRVSSASAPGRETWIGEADAAEPEGVCAVVGQRFDRAERDVACVSLIGHGTQEATVPARGRDALHRAAVPVCGRSRDELRLSYSIPEGLLETAVNALHTEFLQAWGTIGPAAAATGRGTG